MLKRELRMTYSAMMRSLPAGERRGLSILIAERFFALFDLRRIRIIHLFLSIESKNEIDTWPIIDRILATFPMTGITVPRVRDDELETLRFDAGTDLKISDWKVPEPVGYDFAEPQTIDLVLIPLLAFDRRGHRVGYGKGFYDRFLKTCRDDCLKIGLSFFPPVENIDDANENDVRLDQCLTPFDLVKF